MPTREEIYQAILNADKAGDSESVRTLGAYLKTMDAPAAPEAPAPQPSPFYARGAALRPSQRDMLAAFQGPTFGFGDELLGATAGGIRTLFNDKTYQENYENARDFVRGAVETQQKEAPVQTAVTQFVSSLPVGGPLAKLLPGGSSMAGQAATAAGVGGISGAINATGDSKATDASGLASDALKGGGLGLAMGGLGVPILRGVGAGVQSALSRLDGSAAMQYARQKVAEALARDQRTTQQAATRMGRLGPEATIADSAGQNTRQLLDTLATLPGQTKNTAEQVIRDRTSGRGARMIDAAESASGTGGVRMSTQMGDWLAQQEQNAAPLYSQLRQINVAPDSQLVNMINAADQLGASKVAQEIATARQLPFTLNVNSPQPYSMRDLDHVKQGLDQLIGSSRGTKPDGTLTPYGNALNDLRKNLVSKLDSLTGGPQGLYASARNAFAGPAQLMDAANSGRRALSSDAAKIETLQAGMSSSEKDAFALGAFESLRAKLGSQGGQTEILNLWKQPGLQEKLKAIFGNERAYREFASNVAGEARLKQLEAVGRGSQTAARMYGAGDLDVPAVQAAGQAVSSVASGNPMGIVQGVSNLWNRVKLPEPVRNQIGQILLSRNRQGLFDLEDAMRQVNESQRQQAASYGVAAPNLLMPMLNP